MPERLIGAVLKTVERSRVPWVRIPPLGAVLKTVERSRVPWVRIPPPPPFKPPVIGGFFSGFWTSKHFRKYTQNIPLGDYVGTKNNF